MRSFFNCRKPVFTVMTQADTPQRIKELIDKSISAGAEAFGIQVEQLQIKYQNENVLKDLFTYTKDKPVYATNYRTAQNTGKSEDKLAEELLKISSCGADLCDVMGDYFDPQPGELTMNKNAVKKQMELIDKIHANGSKVLMSSHVLKYTPADEVLKIAAEHQKRNADISKIVVSAENAEQQIENLKIINMLKENLDIPFLFLCNGNCGVLRRIGPEFGCCMYLCVYEYDEFGLYNKCWGVQQIELKRNK